jgi:hypothetical protein
MDPILSSSMAVGELTQALCGMEGAIGEPDLISALSTYKNISY